MSSKKREREEAEKGAPRGGDVFERAAYGLTEVLEALFGIGCEGAEGVERSESDSSSRAAKSRRVVLESYESWWDGSWSGSSAAESSGASEARTASGESGSRSGSSGSSSSDPTQEESHEEDAIQFYPEQEELAGFVDRLVGGLEATDEEKRRCLDTIAGVWEAARGWQLDDGPWLVALGCDTGVEEGTRAEDAPRPRPVVFVVGPRSHAALWAGPGPPPGRWRAWPLARFNQLVLGAGDDGLAERINRHAASCAVLPECDRRERLHQLAVASSAQIELRQWASYVRREQRRAFPGYLALTKDQHRVLLAREQHALHVEGAAGTGKTVLAVERARALLARGDAVAVCCFTGPQARMYAQALQPYRAPRLLVADLSGPAHALRRGAFDHVLVDEAHNLAYLAAADAAPKRRRVFDASRRSVWFFADRCQMRSQWQYALIDPDGRGATYPDSLWGGRAFDVERLSRVVRSTVPLARFTSRFRAKAPRDRVGRGAQVLPAWTPAGLDVEFVRHGDPAEALLRRLARGPALVVLHNSDDRAEREARAAAAGVPGAEVRRVADFEGLERASVVLWLRDDGAAEAADLTDDRTFGVSVAVYKAVSRATFHAAVVCTPGMQEFLHDRTMTREDGFRPERRRRR